MANFPASKAIGVVAESLGARDLRDAALAGIFGTLGGWAVFLLWLEERDHSRTFLISLAVAAVVALALEHLREVIREGHGELEHRAFWSVGIAVVVLVLMCELFAKAYAHLAKTANLLPSVLTVLLGSTPADTLDPWWALIGLLGIWAYMGVVAAQWLVGIVPATSRNEGQGRWWWTLGAGILQGATVAVICALAVLIALFAFRLWVALTSREASQALLNQFSGALGIVAWPFRLGQSVWHGLLGWMGPWLAVPAALVVVLGVLLPGLTLLLALRDGGFRGVRRDLVEIGAGWLWIGSFVVVVASPLILQAPKTLIEMAGLAFLVWLVPGVVLGGFVPFLRRLSRSPELWLATALMGAGLVCIAVWLADHAWFWLPLAGLGLVGGVAARAAQTSGDRARPECWPLLPISIALWVYGSTLILEQVTFRLLDDLHTLMSLQPSVTRLMPRQYAGDLMWTFPHGRLPWTGATTMKRELVRRLEQGDAWINERKSDAVSRSFQTVWAFVHGAPDEPHGATRSLSASHSETLHRPLLASLGRLQELARQSPTLVGQLEEISSQGQQMVTEAEALGDTWTANPSGASAPDILVRARQNFAEFIQGAHEIRALLPRLAGTIHQLQQHGGELEALTTQAAPQLARRLELCVSSAFGFWMTLACLAV